MYNSYLTNEQICDALATYKVGDTVTLLKRKSCKYGVAEAGTTMEVAKICMGENVAHRHYTAEEIMDCQVVYEEGVFSYTLTPKNLAKVDDVPYFDCKFSEIGAGVIPPEKIEGVYKAGKKIINAELVKRIAGSFLIILALAALMFGLVWGLSVVFNYPSIYLPLIAAGVVAFAAAPHIIEGTAFAGEITKRKKKNGN